jgi:hypothetical protein
MRHAREHWMGALRDRDGDHAATVRFRLGVRDAALIYLLTPYEVAPASAMALSFLLLARRMLTGLLGGAMVIKESLPVAARGSTTAGRS